MIWVGRITVSVAAFTLIGLMDAVGVRLLRGYPDSFVMGVAGKLLIVAAFVAIWHGIGAWTRWLRPSPGDRP